MNLFLSDWHYGTKSRERRLNGNTLVDNTTPALIRGLDLNVAIREYGQEIKDKNLKEFIDRRLLNSVDLLKLQQDNVSKSHDKLEKNCIQCQVKLKIKKYLESRDAMLP